jgi:hypothetical protein
MWFCHLFSIIPSACLGSSLYSLVANPTENTRFQQFLDCCLRIRCCWNVFTEPLPSNGRLLWLHYYGLKYSCHNIVIRLENVIQERHEEDCLMSENGTG